MVALTIQAVTGETVVEHFCTVSIRRAIRAVVVTAFLFALGCGSALAAAFELTTTVVTTTASTTTPSATTTASATATTTTSTSVGTTAATTTLATTTASPSTAVPATTAVIAGPATTATQAKRPKPANATSCASLGSVAILRPDRPAFVVGPALSGRSPAAAGESLRYPTDGGVLDAAASAVAASCDRYTAPSGSVTLHNVSLFGGTIQTASITLRIGDGRLAASTVDGLRVSGRPIQQRPGGVFVHVGNWALLGTLSALACPGTAGLRESALAVHLLAPRAGLPAGTTLLLAFADLPIVAAHPPKVAALCAGVHGRRLDRNEQLHLPLTVTPPLGTQIRYVFPVAAAVGVFDTYGALRSDVPGGWHHGDDIFAPIGTPIVAVANGTLNRVGWNKSGGWRLWVRDGYGDEFYYAHLSGYTPPALLDGKVEAGEVIGFIGDSGDAIHTPPHLHFEVHPRSLLFLGYDGAVDPTSYLRGWPHVVAHRAPKPVLPTLPKGPARSQAIALYRKLLVLRGFHEPHSAGHRSRPNGEPPPTTADPTAGTGHRSASAHVSKTSSGSGWLIGAPLGATAVLVLAAAAALRLRRRPAATTVPSRDGIEPNPIRAAAATRPGTTAHALVRITIVLLASSTALAALRSSRAERNADKNS